MIPLSSMSTSWLFLASLIIIPSNIARGDILQSKWYPISNSHTKLVNSENGGCIVSIVRGDNLQSNNQLKGQLQINRYYEFL